ncbi:papain-like cysteine protease family protein [Nitrospirillum viridazoti]|uniref:papain-like cysteine protease family protein n=1 Tax=Nitrospirillum viridazoti TaxID=3144925 RepID=UPI00110F8E8A|nr:papain-like cysteine protease family protein [Nitrospirillum amazonense]
MTWLKKILGTFRKNIPVSVQILANRPLEVYPQESPMWCWAAVAQGITISRNGIRLPQWQIVEKVLGKGYLNHPKNYWKPGNVGDALNVLGQSFDLSLTPLSIKDVIEQINARGFVICGIWTKSHNIGHVVALSMVQKQGSEFMVRVHDPAPQRAPKEILWQKLLVNYYGNSDGHWKISYRTPRP